MRNPYLPYASLAGRIVLVVLAILFAICAGPASAAPEPGTVTIVLNQEPPNIDPGETIGSYVGLPLSKNVLETLTAINYQDGSVTPRLATSWKRVDPTTWHFVLRKGVKFHDGENFNAEAVVFNTKRLYDKRINSRTRNKVFSNLKLEGKVLDSHTVELKTDKPEPLVPTLMGVMTICSPNTPMDKWTRQPVGTGPYRFVKWDAGQQIVFERFDGYWGKQPQAKKVIYVWRNESAVRAAMVEIGEADLAVNIAVQDAKRRDMDYSYLNSETTMLRIGGIWEPPLNDRRVRMALNYAVDRDAIRGGIFTKDTIPATQLVIPSTFGYNPDLKVWPYDPQMAKKLLAEARKDGVPVDKEILLLGRIGYYAGSEEMMEALLTMYKAVGFNMKLKMVEPGVMQKAYHDKPYPTNVGPYLMEKSHDNNLGDAAFTIFFLYHCKGGISSTCDGNLDELIERALAAAGEERQTLFRQAFKRAHEEIVNSVMLYHMVGYTRVGKRINFKPSVALSLELPIEQITFK